MTSYTQAATVAAISAILKEKWITDTIQMQYARNRVLTAMLEKSTKEVDGLESVFTMRLRPNVSTGARAEMADLPNPGRQTTTKVRIPLAYWYTACAFTGQAIAASKNSATALAKIITDELENAVEDHKRVENAFMYGDGSGVLTTIASVDAGTRTITVNRWHSLLSEGRKIQTDANKDGSAGGGMAANEIASINRANKTVTFVSAITNAAQDQYMFLEGTVGNANMGLLGICDKGDYVSTFQTLDRSTISQARAKVFGAAAPRNISEDLLMDVIARQREDGANPDLIVGTSFQLKDLCSEAKEDRRFIDPKTGYDLGVSGIKIGDGVDFTFDVDCPAGFCFPLTKKKIIISESAKLGFMDKDGNVLCRITGKDAYEATLFHYYNLIALSCFDHARVENLNENRAGD